MESFSVMFFMEVGLMVLLLACLFYMFIINNKLKMLKSGGDGFKAVVVELSHATDNAQNAIQGLKLTVRDAEHGLDGNLKQARSVAEELKFLIEQANFHGDGIVANNARNLPQTSENIRQVERPIVAQNRAKNFADQTLEKVAQQKQSLPNPIVHPQLNRNEPEVAVRPMLEAGRAEGIGLNLRSEHKEMALQMREQALKSIAAKNVDSNQQILREDEFSEVNQTQTLDQPQLQTNIEAAQRGGRLGVRQNMPRNSASRPRPRPDVAQKSNIGNQRQLNEEQRQTDLGTNMSLSDMVGRHAQMEHQSFVEEDELSSPRAAQSEVQRGVGGVTERRKNLFQKLSETR